MSCILEAPRPKRSHVPNEAVPGAAPVRPPWSAMPRQPAGATCTGYCPRLGLMCGRSMVEAMDAFCHPHRVRGVAGMWITASRHGCAQPARDATGCPSPKQLESRLPCSRPSDGVQFGGVGCAAMLLGTWHLLEVLVVELPCRRSSLEMARSCCRTFASGHVAMVIQQESNESGGKWRREVLRAVLVHGFVGPHTKAAVGPRQQAACGSSWCSSTAGPSAQVISRWAHNMRSTGSAGMGRSMRAHRVAFLGMREITHTCDGSRSGDSCAYLHGV